MNQHGPSLGLTERLRTMQKVELACHAERSITISRCGQRGWFGAGLAVLFAIALAGCGAPKPASIAASAGQAAAKTAPLRATILAVRPVPPAAPQGSGAILTAMGAAAVQGSGEAEIILRTDGGAILSVVQPVTSSLVPGARVVVLTSPSLHLVQPGHAAPMS